VVEISATIRVREPDDNDGDRHQRLLVTVTEIFESDPDVDDDLQRCFSTGEDVFVAIRFGDRMGILRPVPGLEAGIELDLKGEYIPKDRAASHGGEAVSVLHFTHHPVGFLCTPDECFS
jgi:endonuclease G